MKARVAFAVLSCFTLATATLSPTVAVASSNDDACAALLCLAFPQWDKLSECIPPVRRVMRDSLFGKPPRCQMGSSSSVASQVQQQQIDPAKLAQAQGQAGRLPDADSDYQNTTVATCPVQYWQVTASGSQADGTFMLSITCLYARRIAVFVDGKPWTNTLYDDVGNSRTQVCPAAQAAGLLPDDTYLKEQAAFTPDQAADMASNYSQHVDMSWFTPGVTDPGC